MWPFKKRVKVDENILKNINKKIVENAKIFKVIDGTVTEKVGK